MGNLSKCTFLNEQKALAVRKWIGAEMESGAQDAPTMFVNFYNFLVSNGMGHLQQIIFLNTFAKIYSRMVASYQASLDPVREGMVENTNFNDILAIQKALDRAENIDAFIQHNFIEPNLPDTLREIYRKKKEEKETGTTEQKVQDDPDFQELEEQNKKLKAQLDEKIRQLEQRNDDTLREQEIEELRDKNKALAKSAIDFNPRLDGTQATLDNAINRAIRNGFVSLIDLDHHDLTERTFRYDRETGEFLEIERGTNKTINTFSENEFSEKFKGYTLVARPLESYLKTGRKQRTEEEREAFLNGVAADFKQRSEVTVFANSMQKADRSKNFYELDGKGKFEVGEAAKVFAEKISKLQTMRDYFRGQSMYVPLKTLMQNKFKGYRAFLELSDDNSLEEKNVVNVVIEKEGNKVILGNYLYTLYRTSMDAVNGGRDYLNFLDKTVSEIKASKGKLDITDRNFMVADPFHPGQRFGEENRIYQKDSQRFGKNKDSKSSQKLALKNAKELYEAMGFGVSKVYIDKFSTDQVVSGEKSFLPGRAFIAVSPFQTSEDIDGILTKTLTDSGSNIDFERLSKEHQISIIPLSRKELSFEDYFRLVKDNDSISIRQYSPDGDRSSDLVDHGKKNAIFGVGQSFPLHFRFAQAIEYLEDRAASLPENSIERSNAEADVVRAKLFLFNNKNYYSDEAVDRDYLSSYKKAVGFKQLENGEVVFHAHSAIIQSAEDNYNLWKRSAPKDKINMSRNFAANLFGYVPGDKESDLYKRKRIWAEQKSGGDPRVASNLMRQGGIFGDEILAMIKVMGSPEMKNRKVRGKSFSETWMDTGGDGQIKGIMHLPTFNPVVNKNESNAKLAELAPLNEWNEKEGDIFSSDVSNEFLVSEWMPMMPHFKFVPDDSGNIKSGTERKKKSRGNRGSSFAQGLVDKAVKDLSGISYDLSEESAIALYNDLLGDIRGELEFMDSPLEFKDRIVIGRVGKNILQLHSNNGRVSERVLRHEIMHRVVNEAVTPQVREKLYNEAKKAIVDDISNDYVQESQVSQKEADEWLAENYEANYGSYGSRYVSKLPKIVQDLYYFINRLYQKLKGDYSIFRETAEKLENGYFRNNGLNYNGYNGSLLEMAVMRQESLAEIFSSNIEEGKMILDRAVSQIVSDVQYSMFGKSIVDDIESNTVPKSYRQALQESREILRETLVGYEEENDIGDIEVVEGIYDNLPQKAKDIFSDKNGVFEIDNITPFRLKNMLNAVELDGSKEVKMFYRALVSYVLMEDMAKIGMPFLKSKDYHLDLSEFEGIDEADFNHDKLAALFERSEISAKSTFSERVKFFMYNTKFDANEFGHNGKTVNRSHVDAFFKKAMDRAKGKSGEQGDLSLTNIIEAFREEVDALSAFPDSVQYKSAKATFDRFFNLDVEHSFLSIGLRQEPFMDLQSRSHMAVVNAIISAQKSVVIQDFMKINSNRYGLGFETTREAGAKDYKNKTNESIVKKLFKKSVSEDSERYVLSDFAKKNIINNTERYNLVTLPNGKLRLSLHGKNFDFMFRKTLQTSQKNDLNKDLVRKIARGVKSVENGVTKMTGGLTETETRALLSDLGINMSAEALRGFRNSLNSNADKLAEVIAHSYLLVAKQYISENPESKKFDQGAREFIDFMSYNRQDDVSEIIREHKRESKASDEVLNNENPDDLGLSTPVYSPTSFHSTFETLGQDNRLNSYDSRDNIVYVMDGAKENKDKFPSYIHRALNRLSKLRIDSANAAKDMEVDADEYRSERYGAIFSKLYRNPVLTERNMVGQMFYMKGIKNPQQNRSKSFHELNDREFSRLVLGMLIGDSHNSDFYMPLEIQADRSFLPVMAMNKNRRFYAKQNGNNIDFDDISVNELEKIRMIPFHHAARVMTEVYALLGDQVSSDRVASILKNPKDTGSLTKEWNSLERQLQKKAEEDPRFPDTLTPRKHFVMVDGKPVLPPLLKKRMAYTKNDFLNYVRQVYLEFAEGIHSTMKTSGDPDSDIEFRLTAEMTEGKYRNERFKLNDRDISLFAGTEIGSEQYSKMSVQEKINMFHPAMLSAFLTYYINETHLTQALSGDPYLYKFDKVTGAEKLHSYVTEYSKRQAGLTTPKIEISFREEITLPNGEKVMANKRGLGRKLNIAHINNMIHNTLGTRTHDALSMANKNNREGIEEGFEMDTNDGQIYSNFLFQDMLSESMGRENGFRIGSIFKGHNYSFDLQRGDIAYTKGAAMMINSDALSHDQGFLHAILKGMLSSAKINGRGYNNTSLYEIFITTAEDKGYREAESEIRDIYHKARNNEAGLSMEGDIIHLIAPEATEKGNISGVNRINVDANGNVEVSADGFMSKQIDTDGFGAILDLQKDIENKDNDVSLSTQMVFLLGLNGDNHTKAVPLYREIASLSVEEKMKIADEIYDSVSHLNVDRSGIIRNRTALREWFLKKINDNYQQKGNYNLIYDLTSQIGVSSISHPVLFEEIYANVGAAMSRGIVMRMNGFKAVQVSSHNTFMTYTDKEGRYYTKPEVDSMSSAEFEQKGMTKRNLRYSEAMGEKLTDTEVFAGNVLANKYLSKKDYGLSIRGIFNLGGLDLEAVNFDALNSPEHRKAVNEKIMQYQGSFSDFPVFRGMPKKAFPEMLYQRIVSGETLTDLERASVAKILTDRTLEMNRALYGVISRIPGTGKNSSSPVRIVGFVNGYQNAIFTPAEWMFISGSDFDGDTVQFWNYDGKSGTNDKALNTARAVLSDAKNLEEIFSEIDFAFMNKKAVDGKKDLLKGGRNGYVLGSPKTLIDLRSNNATGAALTGINATLAKVHSYATLAQTRFEFFQEQMRKANDGSVEAVDKALSKKFNVMFREKGKKNYLNTGVLFNSNGDYKNKKGDYIYKWNETLTNAAIDNAKHLFMNFIGLNTYNSGIQQAMTFMGFDPETMIEKVIKNETVMNAVAYAMEKDDINKSSRKTLDNVIKEYFSRNSEEEAEDSSAAFAELGAVEEVPMTIKASLKDAPENSRKAKVVDIDFNDADSVMRLLQFLNEASKEIHNVRKILKVTDKIPGRSSDQDYSIRELFNAVNNKIGGRKIDTISSFKRLLNQMDEAENPLMIKEVVEAQANTITTHPLVVLATMPHLREFTRRWLEFSEMKQAHLLYAENTQALMSQVRSQLDHISMRNPRNVALVNREMYKFINGVFLETEYSDYEFMGGRYNMSNISDVIRFKNDFAEQVTKLQIGTLASNTFINKLEVMGSDIVFPGSETMDHESIVPGRRGFTELSTKLKEAFMLYEAATSNFLYRKGSFVAFMDKKSFTPYSSFLRKAEIQAGKGNDVIIRNSKDGQRFVENFMMENVTLLKRMTNTDTGNRDNHYPYSPRSAEEVNESYELSGIVAPVLFKLRTEDESYKKKLEELERKVTELEAKREPVTGTKKKDRKIIERNGKIDQKIIGLESQIAEIKNRKMTDKPEKGFPPFKMIRYYNKEKKGLEFYLFKTVQPKEEGKNTMLKRVYFPKFTSSEGVTVNTYRRNGNIPVVFEKKFIRDNEADVLKAVFGTEKEGSVSRPKKGSEGKYITRDGKVYNVSEDGNISDYQFSFGSRKSTPQARAKASAIAKVISKAFPGVDLKIVQKGHGVFADKAGFVHNGSVYLNMDMIGLDTPMHEFGHIFIDLLEKTDSDLFASISDMVLQTSVYSEIQSRYSQFNNTETDNIKEAFVTLLGEHFANSIDQMAGDIGQENRGVLKGMLNDFIDWIKKMFRDAFSAMNIQKRYINDKLLSDLDATTTLEEMFQLLGGAVLQGEVITDLSTKEIAQLEFDYNRKENMAKESEIDAAINEMFKKGLIKYYC